MGKKYVVVLFVVFPQSQFHYEVKKQLNTIVPNNLLHSECNKKHSISSVSVLSISGVNLNHNKELRISRYFGSLK